MNFTSEQAKDVFSNVFVDIIHRLQETVTTLEELPESVALDKVIKDMRSSIALIYQFGRQELGLSREYMCAHYSAFNHFYSGFPICDNCHYNL